MDQETLWQQFISLPHEARHEVADFIAFLQAKYTKLPIRSSEPASIVDDPFVGLWRDRQDIHDASAWLRDLRKREWHDE